MSDTRLRDWTFHVIEIDDDPPRRYSVQVQDNNDVDPDSISAEFETPSEVAEFIRAVMDGDYD